MTLSRPTVYGLLVVVAAAALWYSSDEPAKPAKKAPIKPGAASTQEKPKTDYTDADYMATFQKPEGKGRDLFQPLIRSRTASLTNAAAQEAPLKIPALLAEGDPNWAFTGIAEVDGQRLALLENSASHQSGFVKEGDPWKGAKIRRITPDSLTMEDQDGNAQVVPRYDPNQPEKPKATPSGGFQPLQFGDSLRGAILPDVRLEPDQASKGPARKSKP